MRKKKNHKKKKTLRLSKNLRGGNGCILEKDCPHIFKAWYFKDIGEMEVTLFNEDPPEAQEKKGKRKMMRMGGRY